MNYYQSNNCSNRIRLLFINAIERGYQILTQNNKPPISISRSNSEFHKTPNNMLIIAFIQNFVKF